MFFNIGVYEPESAAAARNGTGRQLPPAIMRRSLLRCRSRTIETGLEAMTLAVLSAFDHARRK
jgi:hippurate hydrolase